MSLGVRRLSTSLYFTRKLYKSEPWAGLSSKSTDPLGFDPKQHPGNNLNNTYWTVLLTMHFQVHYIHFTYKEAETESYLPRTLTQKGWDRIKAMSHPMEILALKPGREGSWRPRSLAETLLGVGIRSPLFICWNFRGVRQRELEGGRSVCPSPSLPFTGEMQTFPHKALQHFNVPTHWLSVSQWLRGLSIRHWPWTNGHVPGFFLTGESRVMG